MREFRYHSDDVINGRHVETIWEEGHHEPGMWRMLFHEPDGIKEFHCDDAETFNSQIVLFSYILNGGTLIETDWAGAGNSDDVIKMVLEYVGYNEDNAYEDHKELQAFKDGLRDSIEKTSEALSDYMSVEEIRDELKTHQDYYDNHGFRGQVLQERLRVYQDIKEGLPVGVAWDNDSFRRELLTSDDSESKKKALKILSNRYPDFLSRK